MPLRQFRCQQSKRRNQWKIDIIHHGDELRRRILIQFRDRCVIARVDFDHLPIFVNDLGLVIAHLVDLVRDFIEIFLSNDNAN